MQNKCLTISAAHDMNMIKYKYRQHKQLLQQINYQYTHHILNYAGHLINHQYKLKTAMVIESTNMEKDNLSKYKTLKYMWNNADIWICKSAGGAYRKQSIE